MGDAPMVRVAADEVASRWDALVNVARSGQTIVVEHGGEVVAVLVPGTEYAALIRESGLTKGEDAQAADGSARDRTDAHSGDLDAEEVERDVAAAIEAVRAETRARDRALFERFGHLADEELVNIVANAVRAARTATPERRSSARSG